VPRIRRPLLALIVLVLALAIGYGIRATRSDGASPRPSSARTIAALFDRPLELPGPAGVIPHN
jgi:hypothetical protein